MKIKIKVIVISVLFFCININGMEASKEDLERIKSKKLALLAKGTIVFVKKSEANVEKDISVKYEKVLLGGRVPNTDFYIVHCDESLNKGSCCHKKTFYQLIDKK